MRLALFQPDQPGNVGTLLRLAACLDVPLDIVAPCGFAVSDAALKRAALDYAETARVRLHDDWDAFRAAVPGRLLLLSVRAARAYTEVGYQADDILLLGRESGGVPDAVRAEADLAVRIPMAPGRRSLNVALAGSMVLGEALRQTKGFPA